MIQTPFLLQTDGYKLDHRRQYPPGTQFVYSNLTPRSGRNPNSTGTVFFGLQYFLKRYFGELAYQTFFDMEEDYVAEDYNGFLASYLGPNRIGTRHIRDLHQLGYLPLRIKALPEGMFVPYGVPVLTIENTHADFAWVTNYFETLLSSVVWGASTSATTAKGYYDTLRAYAARTGASTAFVPWQGHDFSFRGMFGPEAAALSGAGHLLYFTGTDSIPAIELLRNYYSGEGLIGGSVPATEHSVMSAGGQDTELDTYRRLLELYPSGIVSVVSDTWNLWNVLTETLPTLREQIMARDGKLVIRPDSGDPVKIICGDPDAPEGTPERAGVVTLLYRTFGGTNNDKGYFELDPHVGCIYGDSITPERAEAILEGLRANGYASSNVVFGIGSYTYQYTTRDVHGWAIKATHATVNGVGRDLYKNPVTDDGTKRSHKGRLSVRHSGDGVPYVVQGLPDQYHPDDLLRTVYEDGTLYNEQTLIDVRRMATTGV